MTDNKEQLENDLANLCANVDEADCRHVGKLDIGSDECQKCFAENLHEIGYRKTTAQTNLEEAGKELAVYQQAWLKQSERCNFCKIEDAASLGECAKCNLAMIKSLGYRKTTVPADIKAKAREYLEDYLWEIINSNQIDLWLKVRDSSSPDIIGAINLFESDTDKALKAFLSLLQPKELTLVKQHDTRGSGCGCPECDCANAYNQGTIDQLKADNEATCSVYQSVLKTRKAIADAQLTADQQDYNKDMAEERKQVAKEILQNPCGANVDGDYIWLMFPKEFLKKNNAWPVTVSTKLLKE